MRRFVFVAVTALAACSSATPREPSPAFEVSWLTPTGALPAEVASVRLVRVFPTGTELELFQRTRMGIDEAGGTLAVRDLPTEQDLDLELQGYDAGCTPYVPGCRPLYLGRATARLRAGERRYVQIAMYQVSAADGLDRGTALPPRMLHTATALDDGRVLIAGGFTAVAATECPSDLTATRCFSATASDDAFIFDPATALFYPVQGGMAGARGGHTATRLADGRVLVAGGAESAIFGVIDIGSPVSAREIWIVPRDGEGAVSARADAEIFEPNANAEVGEDVDRDGDPARGGFTGDPSETTLTPIPLNEARFLHAAALESNDRVLLVGGQPASGTYEVFDPRKPGGPGVYDNTGANLPTPRVAPSAIALGRGTNARVWIFGGVLDVASNDQLADVWTADADDPLGSVVAATDPSLALAFPAPVPATTEDHPEYAHVRPAVAALDDGDYALVSGWYGPRCPSGMTNAAPIFSGADACDHRGGLDRTFTVRNDGGATTRTSPPSSARHALASAVQLRDGRVMVVGGVENGTFTTVRATVIYDRVDGNRAAGSGSASLGTGRFFHAAAPIFDSGVVVTGGLAFDPTGATATLVRTNEAILLAPLERGRAPSGSDAGSPPTMDGGT